MRHTLIAFGVLAATLAAASGGTPARAQTPDPVPETQPAATPTHSKVKPKPKPKPATTARTATPAIKPVQVPLTPPPPPSLPPPLVVPVRPMPPPAPAAVLADAAGVASVQQDGLRITFGPGSSDLNPTTEAAIRSLVRAAPPFAATTFAITAVAPGTEEDPSTPRRLSLSRALAVRSVLITEGIASPRIYVKAMGASPQAVAGGPPDRADIVVAGAPPQTAPNQGSIP